jgi:hypothetical protein
VREFSASNATGPSISFGRGFGQGGNSDVVAGGSAVSDATANNGGAAETGFAPVDAVASTSQGGKTTFIGIGSSSAINMGSGFFGDGNPNKVSTPYVSGPSNPGGLFMVASPSRNQHKLERNTN